MKTIAAIFFSLWLLNSCEYQLDSNNFINLQQPDSTYVLFVDIYPEEFPNVLDKPIRLKYTVLPGDLNLLGVRITVNGFVQFESTNMQDSFLIHPYHYDAGNKFLSIDFITDSKSGSLADITGNEALLFRRSWEFYNPDWFYPGIHFKRIFNDNGVLKLEWEVPSIPGFEKYYIQRKTEFSEYPEIIVEIPDISQTEYYDHDYFGGSADYWIGAMGLDTNIMSRSLSVYYVYPQPQVLWIQGSDIQFFWNKSPLDQVVLGYEFSYSSSDTTDAVLFASDNTNDTTYLLHAVQAYEFVKYNLRFKIQGPEPGQFIWSNFRNESTLTYKPKLSLTGH